jgi:hypothetical protein
MLKRTFPAGFVLPAQPVEANRPPAGAEWVHEIKHDGYRLIVYRDSAMVRLYTRKANDWTERLPAIAAAAARLKAASFTIDGEAVVAGPDGLTRFDDLRRRESARVAFLYAFDLLEHDGEDLRNRPLLDRKSTSGPGPFMNCWKPVAAAHNRSLSKKWTLTARSPLCTGLPPETRSRVCSQRKWSLYIQRRCAACVCSRARRPSHSRT